MKIRHAITGLLAMVYVGSQVLPSWEKVRSVKHGRDYATYHYAVQEALDGGDPYNKQALGRRAKAENTRRSVHPYFYPPPFLLLMLWTAPLSLAAGYKLFFWLNQGLLVVLMWCFSRWFSASLLSMAVIAATFSPLGDNAKMGQANLLVLLIATVGLWLGRGSVLSVAAMAKMSPALYLAWWGGRLRFRPIIAAGLGAVVLSILALPLVGLDTQIRFYTEILPGFSSGRYNGLTVPISLPANHSIPDLYAQLWPGESAHVLSAAAKRASSLTSLSLLVVLVALSRQVRDRVGEACLAGSFTVLLLITPVYTYEHHLVFLLLPLVALAAALERGRLARSWWPLVALSYGVVAWPLRWLRAVQELLPAAHWWLQESKFIGTAALGLLCLAAALRSPIVDGKHRQ